jgi:hypothetical protein
LKRLPQLAVAVKGTRGILKLIFIAPRYGWHEKINGGKQKNPRFSQGGAPSLRILSRWNGGKVLDHCHTIVVLNDLDGSSLRKCVHIGVMDSKHYILKAIIIFQSTNFQSYLSAFVQMNMPIMTFMFFMAGQILYNPSGFLPCVLT